MAFYEVLGLVWRLVTNFLNLFQHSVEHVNVVGQVLGHSWLSFLARRAQSTT